MAEDLTEYLHENGIKVRYLHSDIDTLERIEIMRDFRWPVQNTKEFLILHVYLLGIYGITFFLSG